MNKEDLKKILTYCKAHELRGRQSFLGAIYDCPKASALASKLGLYGTFNAQYKQPNGNTMIYINGREGVEFNK